MVRLIGSGMTSISVAFVGFCKSPLRFAFFAPFRGYQFAGLRIRKFGTPSIGISAISSKPNR